MKTFKKKIFFTLQDGHSMIFYSMILNIWQKVKNHRALLLERTNLYGGISLFAPFFKKNTITSVDVFPTLS